MSGVSEIWKTQQASSCVSALLEAGAERDRLRRQLGAMKVLLAERRVEANKMLAAAQAQAAELRRALEEQRHRLSAVLTGGAVYIDWQKALAEIDAALAGGDHE